MVQTCSFCKNHGIRAEKKGHKPECKFLKDNHWKTCIEGCYDTKTRQESVAKDKRNKYQLKKLNKEAVHKQPAPAGKKRAQKMCSKCENHGKDELMNIKHKCFFKECNCANCKITDQRRARVRADVKNIRSNLNTVLNTPPSTPGSSFSQSSPASDAEAASPLRCDAGSYGVYDEPMLTPASMTSHDSPANSSAYSEPSEYDLFATLDLPAISPPSATLVQQDSIFNCPYSELGEHLNEALYWLSAQPEIFQQKVEAVCMGRKS